MACACPCDHFMELGDHGKVGPKGPALTKASVFGCLIKTPDLPALQGRSFMYQETLPRYTFENPFECIVARECPLQSIRSLLVLKAHVSKAASALGFLGGYCGDKFARTFFTFSYVLIICGSGKCGLGRLWSLYGLYVLQHAIPRVQEMIYNITCHIYVC